MSINGKGIKWESLKGKKAKGAKGVVFSILLPHANHVSVAGDFNSWDTEAQVMKKDQAGVWKLSVNLTPGSYQYRFFVDGVWQNDPESVESVPNPFGTLNNVKRVKY